jgi:NAD(P)H dehydrogenase (quinone)
VILKRVGEVTADDLLSSDAVIVGSPVYFGNMAGEVKTFFDNWLLKFDFFREFKMRNKVGGAFATGGSDLQRQGDHNDGYSGGDAHQQDDHH